tara:strand:- start:3215 stop:4105 length:891 start_codon:yes stop_codon:yes gene_type:complete
MTISKLNTISTSSISKIDDIQISTMEKINLVDLPSGFSTDFSLDLNGSTQYVNLGDLSSTALEPTQSSINTSGLSFTAWIYIDSLSGGEAVYNIGNSGTNNYGGFKVIVNGNGALVLHVMGLNQGFFGSGSSNRNTTRTANSTIAAGQWYHIAAVIPAGSMGTTQNRNAWLFYINGSAYSGTYTRSGNNNVTLNYLGDSSLGAWTRSSPAIGSPFDGELNNLAVFSTELNATNISAIYNSGTPIDLGTDAGGYNQSANLTAWWRFNEGTGTSYTDSSGNGFTGTGVGSPTFSTNVP